MMYRCKTCNEYKSISLFSECSECKEKRLETEKFAEIGKALMTLNSSKEFGVTINIPKMLKEYKRQENETE